MIKSNLDFICHHQTESSNLGQNYTPEGDVLDWDGEEGIFWIAALVEGYRLTGDKKYLQASEKAGEHYKAAVEDAYITGAPEAMHLLPTSEDPQNAVISYILLWEETGDDKWLEVAKLSAEDARTLSVTPWEKDMVGKIEKAIMTSDLGLNPSSAGTVIRIPMPPLTEERRRDLGKVVRNEGENAKIAIRNVRRDANNDLKGFLKEKEISEDEERRGQDTVQKLTDERVAEVDQLVADKEKELMEV